MLTINDRIRKIQKENPGMTIMEKVSLLLDQLYLLDESSFSYQKNCVHCKAPVYMDKLCVKHYNELLNLKKNE